MRSAELEWAQSVGLARVPDVRGSSAGSSKPAPGASRTSRAFAAPGRARPSRSFCPDRFTHSSIRNFLQPRRRSIGRNASGSSAKSCASAPQPIPTLQDLRRRLPQDGDERHHQLYRFRRLRRFDHHAVDHHRLPRRLRIGAGRRYHRRRHQHPEGRSHRPAQDRAAAQRRHFRRRRRRSGHIHPLGGGGYPRGNRHYRGREAGYRTTPGPKAERCFSSRTARSPTFRASASPPRRRSRTASCSTMCISPRTCSASRRARATR